MKTKILETIDRIGDAMNWVAIGIVAILAFPICYDAIARSMGKPTIWVFEISIYALAASAFLANAVTLRKGAHFRITLLSKLFPHHKRLIDGFSYLVTLIFGVILMVSGTMFAWNSFINQIESATLLSIPMYIPESVLALGGFALTIQAVALLLDDRRYQRLDADH